MTILLGLLLALASCGGGTKDTSESSHAESVQTDASEVPVEIESEQPESESETAETESEQSDVSEEKHYEEAPENVTVEYESNQTIEIH